MPSTYQSIVVDRPAETVWRVTRDFHDLHWAVGVIDECEPVGTQAADQIGARRAINGVFFEELLEISDLTRTLKYRIYDGPSPLSPEEVADFVAAVAIRPVTEQNAAFVEWSARWNGEDPGGVTETFCHEIFSELLRSLKAYAETLP